MKYNGKELKEITTPQIFAEPKKMLVWNDKYVDDNSEQKPNIDTVYAVVKIDNHYVAVTWGHYMEHCAEIPKARRVTNRELSKWLAQGNGEYSNIVYFTRSYTTYEYELDTASCEVSENFLVRKWSDDDWHEPTTDYMFGEAL